MTVPHVGRKMGRPRLPWLRVFCPKCGHKFGFRYKIAWTFRDVFKETSKAGSGGPLSAEKAPDAE